MATEQSNLTGKRPTRLPAKIPVRSNANPFIKLCDIPRSLQEQPFRPGRRTSHLITDGIRTYPRIRFDYRLIMYAHHDIAAPECLHGTAQNVPGHRLDDVLRKLGAAAGQS